MKFQINPSLKKLNTFGIDVRANMMLTFRSVIDLKEILKGKVYQANEHIILGGGSNILFTKNLEGLVLKNEIYGKEILEENDDFAYVKFGAGENWHECVLWAIAHNFGGIENLSLIPGTMGAAPMQNIGAYGVEIKSVIEKVFAIEKTTGLERVFDNCDCEFGYRESVFKHTLKNKFIITHVVLRLSKKHDVKLSYGAIAQELDDRKITEPTIKDVSDVVISIRESKLPNPKEIGNAGSFFKNPVVSQQKFDSIIIDHPEMPSYVQEDGVKIPAGWLIENAGWKGYVSGEVGVHKKQALVLVNYGNAKGYEVYNLSEQIINDVEFRYGIALQREVNIL